MRVSFGVSELIAKTGKAHTVDEELILPTAEIMVSVLINIFFSGRNANEVTNSDY